MISAFVSPGAVEARICKKSLNAAFIGILELLSQPPATFLESCNIFGSLLRGIENKLRKALVQELLKQGDKSIPPVWSENKCSMLPGII
jgi:hypothetical protein